MKRRLIYWIALNVVISWNSILSEAKEERERGPGSVFGNECLRIHNVMRKRHGAPVLVLNETLNKAANEWAKEIGNAAENNGVRNSLKWKETWNIGENCGGLEPPNNNTLERVFFDGGYAPRAWYKEILVHKYDNSFQASSSHFTQIIWADSKELGVGKFTTPKGQLIVVCFYYPAGNWNYADSFAANVKKPLQGDPNSIPDNPDFIKFLIPLHSLL